MVGQAEAPSVPPRRRWRVVVPVVLLAALPWAWFAVRDAFGVVTDVIAIGIPVLVAGVVTGYALAALRRPMAWVLAVSTLLAGTVAVVGPWLPADRGAVGGTGVTVAGANTDYLLTPAPALRELPADVLVVAELHHGLGAELPDGYPHRITADRLDVRVGVFSRYPIRLLEDSGPDLPGMRLEVDGPDGPFVLYALHIPRPWITGEGDGYQTSVAGHYEFAATIAERVRAETLPTVVVGDLNSTDRGRDYRTLLRDGHLTDAMRDTWGGPTSVRKWLPLLGRIDHVLVSAGWCGDDARRAELPGSSHRAVVATVGPCVAPDR